MDLTYFSGTFHSAATGRAFTFTGNWWRHNGEVHWKARIESEGQPPTSPEGAFKVPNMAPEAGVRRAVRVFIETSEKERSRTGEGQTLDRFSSGDVVAITIGGATREGRIAAIAPDYASASVELDRPQGERREQLVVSVGQGGLATLPGAHPVKIRRLRSGKVPA